MSFIETTPAAHARGALRDMYLRQQSAWGYVPNYAKVFCYRPQVMARWGQLLAEIKRPMAKRSFELITFAAAHELRHSACALAHGRALREFFSDAQILAIAEDRLEGVLVEAEQAVVRFARQIARDASSVSAAQVATLHANGYTAAQIFDIAATAAGRAFFSKLLDALGVLPDSPFLAEDEAFRRTLTIGRAIGNEACETVAQTEPGESEWESG
ncbi:MAG TPA: hypothetical protein VER12_08175 [Polyangiaceae bacterium]|nr:hypothetical protein [Polyangiaceae bacterium]